MGKLGGRAKWGPVPWTIQCVIRASPGAPSALAHREKRAPGKLVKKVVWREKPLRGSWEGCERTKGTSR